MADFAFVPVVGQMQLKGKPACLTTAHTNRTVQTGRRMLALYPETSESNVPVSSGGYR